jgi:hypothetical protein
MLLIPYPSIGMGKTKIILVFDSPFMRDLTFTVSATNKERRDFTKSSTVSLRSLRTATTCITDTASAIVDFTEALEQVELDKEEVLFLEPLLMDVLNAVKATTKDARMRRGTHRLKCLQSVLKSVTTRL